MMHEIQTYKFKVGQHVEVKGIDISDGMKYDSIGVILDTDTGDRVHPYHVRLYDNNDDGRVIEMDCSEDELDYMMPSKPYYMRKKYVPTSKPISDSDVEIIFKQVLEARKKLLGEGEGVTTKKEKDVLTDDSGIRHEPVKFSPWVRHPSEYDSMPRELQKHNYFIEIKLKNGKCMQGFAKNFYWGTDTVAPGYRITDWRRCLS